MSRAPAVATVGVAPRAARGSGRHAKRRGAHLDEPVVDGGDGPAVLRHRDAVRRLAVVATYFHHCHALVCAAQHQLAVLSSRDWGPGSAGTVLAGDLAPRSGAESLSVAPIRPEMLVGRASGAGRARQGRAVLVHPHCRGIEALPKPQWRSANAENRSTLTDGGHAVFWRCCARTAFQAPPAAAGKLPLSGARSTAPPSTPAVPPGNPGEHRRLTKRHAYTGQETERGVRARKERRRCLLSLRRALPDSVLTAWTLKLRSEPARVRLTTATPRGGGQKAGSRR
jgi:hypothetical protein